MIGELTLQERIVLSVYSDYPAVDVVPEFMTERRGDGARMMRGVYKNYELALIADVGATVEAAQRKSGAGFIGLGAKLELARTEKIFQMRNQLRTRDVGQAFVRWRM